MRTRRSPRNQQRLWNYLGNNAKQEVEAQTIGDKIRSSEYVLSHLRPGSPAFAAEMRVLANLRKRTAA